MAASYLEAQQDAESEVVEARIGFARSEKGLRREPKDLERPKSCMTKDWEGAPQYPRGIRHQLNNRDGR